MTFVSPGQHLVAQLELQSRDDVELRLDEPMARHNTLRLGGPADVWLRPSSAAALIDVLARAAAHRIAVTFVGSGSNLLCLDGGIRGLVVNLGRLRDVRRGSKLADRTRIHVDAGASTGRLLQHATQWELGGVEFLGGVPGSVGGGLVMNAGTYLGEFKDVVAEVCSVRVDGTRVIRNNETCGFGYRTSALPPDEVVVSASLDLPSRPRVLIEADVAALRQRRNEREPHGVPNSGSTFKNPPGDYAGRLIEAAGLKGQRVGAALVSPVHANWLVIDRDCGVEPRAADLVRLIEHVRSRVLEVHGIGLELEVKTVGEHELPTRPSY